MPLTQICRGSMQGLMGHGGQAAGGEKGFLRGENEGQVAGTHLCLPPQTFNGTLQSWGHHALGTAGLVSLIYFTSAGFHPATADTKDQVPINETWGRFEPFQNYCMLRSASISVFGD